MKISDTPFDLHQFKKFELIPHENWVQNGATPAEYTPKDIEDWLVEFDTFEFLTANGDYVSVPTIVAEFPCGSGNYVNAAISVTEEIHEEDSRFGKCTYPVGLYVRQGYPNYYVSRIEF